MGGGYKLGEAGGGVLQGPGGGLGRGAHFKGLGAWKGPEGGGEACGKTWGGFARAWGGEEGALQGVWGAYYMMVGAVCKAGGGAHCKGGLCKLGDGILHGGGG